MPGNLTDVLLVEDNPGDARLVRELLSGRGDLRIRHVVRLDEALQVLGERPCDVVLLDLGLPDSQGLATLDEALARAPRVPVVVFTGQDDETTGRAAVSKGAQDFLVKGRTSGWMLERAIAYAVERNEHQAKLEHLNSVLRAIRNVNQLIVREKDPARLVQTACELLIETREYRGVWIAIGEPGAPPDHVGQAGWGPEFDAFRDGLQRGDAPPCQVQAHSCSVVVIDPGAPCGTCPLRSGYDRGLAAVVRIAHAGRTFGVLGVRLPPGGRIDDEERDLLVEVAGDLALALDGMQTTTRMRDSEAEHAALYDQAPVLLLLVDAERRVRKANRQALAAAGAESPLGRRGGEALRCVRALDDSRGCGFGPACPECTIRRTVVDTLATGQEHRQVPATLRVLDEGGREREVFFQLSTAPITLGGERLAHVCLLDVTDLALSRQRYRSLVDHMLNGIAYCRMIFEGDRPVDFVYEAVNPAFQAQTGLADVVGRRVSEVIPGIREQDPALFETLGRVVTTGVPERFEMHVASLGMWFELSAFRPASGHFAAVFDVVTDRKLAEQRLRESEAQYRRLFTTAHDAILIAETPSGRVTACNPAAIRMFGARDEPELCARTPWSYSPPVQPDGRASDEKAAEVLAIALNEGFHLYEWRHRRADGGEFAASVQLIRFDVDGRRLVQAIVRDITELDRMREQLWRSQRLESVGRLAGGVAHDFNNLLSVINGNAAFAREALSAADPVRGDVEEILHAGERAAALTRQLLAFSRKQVLQPEVLDLNRVIAGIEGLLRRLLGEDVAITTRLADDLGVVLVDPAQLEQVIVNLAVNARDAMLDGGELVIATANVDVDPHAPSPGPHGPGCAGRRVLLSVSDTGHGMDAATLGHIFEPFFTTKEKGKGTGLGLATVLGIVEQSGGTIRVRSEPGHGATFEVRLPRVDAPVAEPRPPAQAGLVPGHEMVLVVEDEDAVRRLAVRILERAGYRVLGAASGGEALLLTERHGDQIALLVTDVVMPLMSGPELADRLTKICPGLRVLYTSGYTDEALDHHGLLEARARFIGKPFTAEELARKVREMLDCK